MPEQPAPSQPGAAFAEEAESLLSVEVRLAEAVTSWLGGLRRALGEHRVPGRTEHVGRIAHVADGVAGVNGLPDARFNELLRFPGDVYGLAFNLDADEIGCVLLGDDTELSAGDPVRLPGEVAVVPVGSRLTSNPLNGVPSTRELAQTSISLPSTKASKPICVAWTHAIAATPGFASTTTTS